MSVENVSKYGGYDVLTSKRKHLNVAKKFKLLDYYEKVNVSARALVDNLVDMFIIYIKVI